MAAIKGDGVISFGGYNWEAQWSAGIAFDDWAGGWGNDVFPTPRPGAHPTLGPVAGRARELTIDFTVRPGIDRMTAYAALLAGLQPENPEPRLLVAELNDGSDTPVQRYAVIRDPHIMPPSRAVNTIKVVFVSPDPAWRLVTPPTYAEALLNANNTVTWESLLTPNDGSAPAHPILTLTPVSLSNGLFKHRRTVTLTNNGDETWTNEPIQIDLGDTTAWVGTNKALADGGNVFLFLDGIEQPRDLIGFNKVGSWLWLVVAHLPPGESLTYDIVYGGTPATAPLDLAGTFRPAIDIRGDAGTASGTQTSTTIRDGSKTWVVNEWIGGRVEIVAGTGAGQERSVDTNSTNTLTVTSAWTTTPDATSQFVVRRSQNALWIWHTQLVERPDLFRGLWYLSTAEGPPSTVAFDVPGAWRPIRLLSNPDATHQPGYSRVAVPTDEDSFAILDAKRAAQGQARYPSEGAADGVAFDSALPLTDWYFGYELLNPNAVAKAFFGSREDGAGEWAAVLEDSQLTELLTDVAAANQALPSGTRHLVAALLPVDGSEIGPEWVHETGARTSGGAAGTATVTDATKAWATNQYLDGVFRVVSGTGAGQWKNVSANTADTLTFTSNLAVALDNTSRYEIVNPKLEANLRSGDVWWVERDVSDLAIGAVSAEADNYPIILLARLDGGESAAPPYAWLRIGLDGRIPFLTSAEVVQVETGPLRAWVENGAGTWLRDITACCRIEDVEADEDGGRMAANALTMTAGSHTFYLQNRAVGNVSAVVAVPEGHY